MHWLASLQPHEVKQESVLLPATQIPKVPLPYFCVCIPVILAIIQHLALGAVRLGLSPSPQALRSEALSVVSTIIPGLSLFSPTHPVSVRPREHLKRGKSNTSQNNPFARHGEDPCCSLRRWEGALQAAFRSELPVICTHVKLEPQASSLYQSLSEWEAVPLNPSTHFGCLVLAWDPAPGFQKV